MFLSREDVGDKAANSPYKTPSVELIELVLPELFASSVFLVTVAPEVGIYEVAKLLETSASACKPNNKTPFVPSLVMFVVLSAVANLTLKDPWRSVIALFVIEHLYHPFP